MDGRRRPITEPPGSLPGPNGSDLFFVGTLLGSILFGWMHQLLWLAAPPFLFISYALLETGRSSLWAKREMDLPRFESGTFP